MKRHLEKWHLQLGLTANGKPQRHWRNTAPASPFAQNKILQHSYPSLTGDLSKSFERIGIFMALLGRHWQRMQLMSARPFGYIGHSLSS